MVDIHVMHLIVMIKMDRRKIIHLMLSVRFVFCESENDYSLIVPPIISPIPQIEISMNEESISRSIRFSCRLQRGSIENLSFQWFYANQTLIEVNHSIIPFTSSSSSSTSQVMEFPLKILHDRVN